MGKAKKRKLRLLIPTLIKELFAKASKDEKNADDYVRKARNLSMKINAPLSSEHKRRICKHCKIHFNSKNSRVRTRDGMLIYYCRECKKYSKFGFKREQKAKRKSKQSK
jgi:RNase P subunit RPR2